MYFHKKIKSISVVIPAFNEDLIIAKSITLLDNELKSMAEDYEIIVVDDGSYDKTRDILSELACKNSRLTIMRNDYNSGLGVSLRKGFNAASKKLVFYTDADLPIKYSEIYIAAEILEENDLDFISGFKNNNDQDPIYRIVYSAVFNYLVKILFKVKVRDINFAFKLLKAETLKKLDLKSSGAFIDAEMVIKSIYLGLKFKQIPVSYFSRTEGSSCLSTPYAILKLIREIIKYYPYLMQIKEKSRYGKLYYT